MSTSKLLNELLKSGDFNSDGIPWLIKEFSKNKNCESITRQGNPVSTEIKKKYGINPKIKIGEDFFNTLSENGKQKRNPKTSFEVICLKMFHNSMRKDELKNLKKNAFTRVTIRNCGDERDCKLVNSVAGKYYNIDEVPILPLSGCDALYCRCIYEPDLYSY